MTTLDFERALSYRDALDLLDLVQAMQSFARVELQINGMRISVEADKAAASAPPLQAQMGMSQARIVAVPALGTLRFNPEVKPGSTLVAGAPIGVVDTLGQATALTAEETCTILEVLVADDSFVEYGQPVLRVAR